MPGPPSRVRVPCTFPGCGRTFGSDAEMKKHKISDLEHEYCSRCDEDFQDEERLLIHKIKSNKHIICPICGSEFRSESGRDHHIMQNHRTEQDLTCYCQAKFKSGATMINHIDKNECPVVSSTQLVKERARKTAFRYALEASELRASLAPGSESDDDREASGGVSLSNVARLNKEAINNQPKSDDDNRSAASTKLSLKHWPRLGEQRQSQMTSESSDLMAFSELSIDHKGKENKGVLDQQDGESTAGRSKHSSDSWRHEGSQAGMTLSDPTNPTRKLPTAGQVLHTLFGHWDATVYFDSFVGRYRCPCGCGYFDDARSFEEHLLIRTNIASRVRCPRCMRVFKATAALVAHCESATTRCNIRYMDNYAQLIGEITGGVIEPNGYLNDGTIKFERGTLTEMPKNTTIGVDLDKVVKGRLP
ncbi:hypothetical protein DTO207G8_7283 [Paecilomyces variotii]|nr:hypothetical protein DTO207G8_7283 [Paecilomyces variotii]KAJ9366790.1 hypothetical protein DTO282E5_8531 [Paecilomyces variotii]